MFGIQSIVGACLVYKHLYFDKTNFKGINMTKSIKLIVALSLLWVSTSSMGAILYADNQLTSDCTTYNPTAGRGNSACGQGSSSAYIKVQDAILNMDIGDTIYIRGGTYHEVNGNRDQMIYIPPSLSGDSWEEGHYNTLASYPGEWAIIDGRGEATKGVVLGNKGMSSGDYGYWKFERLEITGGTSPGDDSNGGAALWLTRGPFIVRYCYIHDNFDDNNDNNPSGITTYRLVNSTIEYNYFYRNGFTGNNGGTINMFPDYNDESQGQDDLVDIGRAQYGNIIRYNYFLAGGSRGAIKMKGSQMLGPNIAKDPNGGGWPRKNLGDKIHHNIIADFGGYGVNIRQDFAQVHHNIFVNNSISSSEYNQYGRRMQAFYNNTIIGGGYNQHNKERPTAWIPPAYYSEDYVINNIFDNFVRGTGDMDYPIVYRPNASTSYRSSISSVFNKGAFKNNYIYRPGRSGDMISVASGRTGEDIHFGRFTVDEYDSLFSTSNYFKQSSESTDELMSGTAGANRYIPRASHTVEGSRTIENGGSGGDHPYLENVVIPSYLGATNPCDSAWVDGLLTDLTSTGWLRGQTGTPEWVVGSTSSSGICPPLPPQNVH
jgi:hypothetical protein